MWLVCTGLLWLAHASAQDSSCAVTADQESARPARALLQVSLQPSYMKMQEITMPASARQNPNLPYPDVSYLERYDKSCWGLGAEVELRDSLCRDELVCARAGFDGRDFGDCPNSHCCSLRLSELINLEWKDETCYQAGSTRDSRDKACKDNMVCARAGFDSRLFGDCPNKHCCSQQVLPRFDSSCWAAGLTLQARDAACEDRLVCARAGFDDRNFGDCPGKHCCSMEIGILEEGSKECWSAGNDMTSRDAACKGDMVCRRKGYDDSVVGCDDGHCCSELVRSRYDTTCWAAGATIEERDNACEGNLKCARSGYDDRTFGDCPNTHCCSEEVIVDNDPNRVIYGVGPDNKVHKQLLSDMSASSTWNLAGLGPMIDVAVYGNKIYGVGTDKHLYQQDVNAMTTTSEWALANSNGELLSVDIDGDTIYGVGTDKKVYKQTLSTMTTDSPWTWAGQGLVTSIAIDRATKFIYATATDYLVYMQKDLANMASGIWEVAGAGQVKSVAVSGDTIFGLGKNNRVWQQKVASMTPSIPWTLAGKGDVSAIAITKKAEASPATFLAMKDKKTAVSPTSKEQVRQQMAMRAFALMDSEEEAGQEDSGNDAGSSSLKGLARNRSKVSGAH
jgi:hypothetical protein